MNHPDQHHLTAYGLGQLDDHTSAEIHAHLDVCESCRHIVESLPADRIAALVRSALVSGARLHRAA